MATTKETFNNYLFLILADVYEIKRTTWISKNFITKTVPQIMTING